MSINRNRAKLKKAKNNREYRLINMHVEYNYCYICQKRGGTFYASCHPAKRYGWHGNGKQVFSTDRREYRTWKYNRKKQWKEGNTGLSKE